MPWGKKLRRMRELTSKNRCLRIGGNGSMNKGTIPRKFQMKSSLSMNVSMSRRQGQLKTEMVMMMQVVAKKTRRRRRKRKGRRKRERKVAEMPMMDHPRPCMGQQRLYSDLTNSMMGTIMIG